MGRPPQSTSLGNGYSGKSPAHAPPLKHFSPSAKTKKKQEKGEILHWLCFSHELIMDIPLMGFSCGDGFDEKESEAVLIDESRDTAGRGSGMEVRPDGAEGDVEFWPIEHPVEPPDEDRPVKCPMPDSSVMNNGGMHEEQYAKSMRKKPELSAAVNKEGTVGAAAAAAAEPPVRAVRKRHHNLTRGDHIITPLMRMPPLPPLPTQNITIFQMLQQFNEFES
ncbi:hypothetical protein L1049_006409 [Liquidambar formosana]|uniref:Uncharacterized protein n=1 Tax=Liquidambar formosana TaxID=63359 RepID=A0AAP0RGY8_LIQFO